MSKISIKNIKEIANKLQPALRPMAGLLPIVNQKQKTDLGTEIPPGPLQIGPVLTNIQLNSTLDSKSTVRIITCLKNAQHTWSEFLNSNNKNGQVCTAYEIRLKKIQQKLQEELCQIFVTGSIEKIKQSGEFLKPMIQFLNKRALKFKQHQNKFKVISRQLQNKQLTEPDELEQEIKEEMLDLVDKFKKYMVSIQQNLQTDTSVIKQIEQSQDKQLNSLQNKNTNMQQIIKQQKLGFFQLIAMGIFALVLWVVGLMIIIVI